MKMRHYLMFLTALGPIWWAIAIRFEFRAPRHEETRYELPPVSVVHRSRTPWWILAAALLAFLATGLCGCGSEERYPTVRDAVADIATAWCARAIELDVYTAATVSACELAFIGAACEEGGCDDAGDPVAAVDDCIAAISSWGIGSDGGYLPPACKGVL